MNNNDILIRIRYALNLKDGQMVKIFKLGGVEVTEEEVKKMITKVNIIILVQKFTPIFFCDLLCDFT